MQETINFLKREIQIAKDSMEIGVDEEYKAQQRVLIDSAEYFLERIEILKSL